MSGWLSPQKNPQWEISVCLINLSCGRNCGGEVMLDATQHAAIALLFRGGKSLNEISRLSGYARNTIRRVLCEKPSEPKSLSIATPRVKRVRSARRRKMDAFEDYATRRLTQGRINCVQLLDALRQKGFSGSLAAVQRYVRRFRAEQLKGRLTCAIPYGSSLLTDDHNWILRLMQGMISEGDLRNQLGATITADDAESIAETMNTGCLSLRNRAVSVAAHLKGISSRATAQFLHINRGSVFNYLRRFHEGGLGKLLDRSRKEIKKSNDPIYTDALFKILHSPPQSHGFNRTSWRMQDLKQALSAKGMTIAVSNIRQIIRKAGFRFRKAKKVLTSNDPDYRKKLIAITEILRNLKADEKFFSVDEFGPFAVKLQGGKSLVMNGQFKSVPAYQSSKGSLIATAALELSENQITHFFSERKNTAEMIKLLDILLAKYTNQSCIYFSWDAASWHASKKLYRRVEEVNSDEYRTAHKTPMVKLAPLPSCAQFLNVIESVFSGMARAIIHNSDYQSIKECMTAIDRHFSDRNQHFRDCPMRAGDKIWGKEVVPASFAEANNCKDPRWSNG